METGQENIPANAACHANLEYVFVRIQKSCISHVSTKCEVHMSYGFKTDNGHSTYSALILLVISRWTTALVRFHVLFL